MNASYFVLVAAFLTFVTGFFVAAIIWGIKLLLAPKSERVSSNSVHLLHILSKHDSNSEFAPKTSGNKSGQMNTDSVNNMELYRYYHGKN